MGLCILFPVLITVIPKYAKWAPAFAPLLFLSVNSLWAAATTQLTNFLSAVGRIKTTFKLMIMWTVLTWALVPVFSLKFGVTGSAFAYLLVGTSSGIAFYIVKKYLNWSIYRSVAIPLICAGAMGLVLIFIKYLLPGNQLKSLVAMIMAGGITYLSLLYLFIGNSLIADAKKLVENILKK